MSGQYLTLLLSFMFAAVTTHTAGADKARPLPRPRLKQIPVLATINKRRSERELARRRLPEEVLSEILWAAYGINRPGSGKRTAPSSHNEQEIDVYAVMQQGTFLYDARQHGLVRITGKDLRALTGRQQFPADAPLNLVYVLDYSRTPNIGEHAREVGAVAVGAIAENVYLYCAGTGLATVFRGWIDKDKLARAMQLTADQYIVGAQTVGYPAAK